jgi:phenylalanyl-tRNA synthetase beta chain
VVGRADLVEEIARIYGYERIPEAQMADTLPPQRGNPDLELEERARDLLVDLGLQEVITYSLTHPDRERRLLPAGTRPDDRPYVTLVNPIVTDRVVMRHSLLGGVLDVLAANLRLRDRLALFEVGAVYLPGEDVEGGKDGGPGGLPDEHRRLAIALTGPREPVAWQGADRAPMDFYDLKGIVEALAAGLHLAGIAFEAPEPEERHPSFMPGRTARLLLDGTPAGWLGELHPLVRERHDLPAQPILAANLDLELMLARADLGFVVAPVPAFPPVKEDLAVVVDEAVPAARVQAVIAAAGGALLAGVTLFDVYRGPQIGAGKKSLAYGLTYQAPDRTLTDAEVARQRGRIVSRLQAEVGATLRG